MIALTYLGDDKREHLVQFDDHEEISCMRLALERAGYQITRIWVIGA